MIRQFGVLLKPSSSGDLDAAIGNGLNVDFKAATVYPIPTDVFDAEANYQVAGRYEPNLF